VSAIRAITLSYLWTVWTHCVDYMDRLPCSFMTVALLGSFAAQSQLGDHIHATGSDYLKDLELSQRQDDELLDRIADLHRTHRSPVTHSLTSQRVT